MKKFVYGIIPVLALACAACTFAIYNQKGNTNSTQKVENPTSASADSASITITNPIQ